jgi:hypothetical protein
LAALLAVVAIAARGEHPGGSARLHQREVPAAVSNDLLTLLLIACLVALVVLLVAAIALRRESWQAPPRRSWWQQLLLVSIVLGLLTLGGYRTILAAFGDRSHDHARGAPGGGGIARLPSRQPEPSRPADFDWVLAAVIAGGVLVVGAVVLVRRRRADPVAEEPAVVEEELASAVSDAIDDLRAEKDPRRAVIAAYARMERVLAQHGHGRRPSEAPYEYLPRALRALRVAPAAAERLTALFERAKFSSHDVDPAMKEQAIDALVAVRDDLQAVAPAA